MRDTAFIQLTRWQFTSGLLGVFLLAGVIFFVGVVVGRSTAKTPLPAQVASVVDPVNTTPSLRAGRSRSRSLAAIEPGTRTIDRDLARPIQRVVPRDKTDAARIETHVQLAKSRASGVVGLDGPTDGHVGAAHAPVMAAAGGVGPELQGFTLQVSAFDSQGPAKMVADQLQGAGHPARIRKVSANGRMFYRVEVGHFANAQETARFQRQFEAASGYSTVLVTTL